MLEIVMLHDVLGKADATAGPYACAIHDTQLEAYLAHKKDWISWRGDDLENWLRLGRPALKRPAYLITIDDAYATVLTRALPILERFKANALVFAITRCAAGWEPVEPRLWRALNSGASLDGTPWRGLALATPMDIRSTYEIIRAELKPLHPHHAETRLTTLFCQTPRGPQLYLNWDEMVALANHPCIEFGSHTHEHAHLPTIGFRETWNQLVSSRRELQERLRKPIRWLSYPYGATSPRVMLQARAAGYSAAFLARPGPMPRRMPMTQFMIPRMDLHEWVAPSGV